MYSQDVELAYVCKYFPAQYFCNSYNNKALIPQTQKKNIVVYIYRLLLDSHLCDCIMDCPLCSRTWRAQMAPVKVSTTVIL